MSRSAVFRLVVILTLLVGVAVGLTLPPVKEALAERVARFLEWVRGIGAWGPVILAGVYAVAAVALIPGSLLTLGAGALFGLERGTAAVSIGSTLGACAAFWVGRTLARGLVEARVAHRPKFRAIDQAVAEHGFKIVLLVRLSPVFPYNVMNYAFGLTNVRFRDYALATWIGMLPATLVYVYLGTLLGDLARLNSQPAAGSGVRQVLFYGGLAATIAVTVVITRTAKAALARAVPGVENDSEPSAPRLP